MEICTVKMDRLILLNTGERIERGEIVSLARSIVRNGLLVPLTVRRILHTDRYEIISGSKRFYAARIARLDSVPVCVVDAPSAVARAAVKRGDKQDLFDEAEGVRAALLGEDMSAEELADATGYSEKEILALLRLTKMGEFEREMVRRNGVSKEIASEIAFFDDVCKRTELLSDAIRSRLKLSEVTARCEREKRGKHTSVKSKAVRSPKFRDLRLFDNTLSRAMMLLKDAGVNARLDTDHVCGATEYKIRIEN